MARSFISNPVSLQDGAEISKSLTKSIWHFYLPSKSVMKFHIMKLKCFSESKQIRIFLVNLDHNWNTFRWKTKIIFRTSEGRLKYVLFYWDKRTNFERTKYVHFRSHADWDSTTLRKKCPHFPAFRLNTERCRHFLCSAIIR